MGEMETRANMISILPRGPNCILWRDIIISWPDGTGSWGKACSCSYIVAISGWASGSSSWYMAVLYLKVSTCKRNNEFKQ